MAQQGQTLNTELCQASSVMVLGMFVVKAANCCPAVSKLAAGFDSPDVSGEQLNVDSDRLIFGEYPTSMHAF